MTSSTLKVNNTSRPRGLVTSDLERAFDVAEIINGPTQQQRAGEFSTGVTNNIHTRHMRDTVSIDTVYEQNTKKIHRSYTEDTQERNTMYYYSEEDASLKTHRSDMGLTFRGPNEDFFRTADIHQLYRNNIVRDHNSRMNKIHCDVENARMIEKKRSERERARSEDLAYDHLMAINNQEARMQEQEELLKRRTTNKSLAQAHLNQISEKELECRRLRHQEIQERAKLNESFAQERRQLSRAARDRAEFKKQELNARAEEIEEKRRNRAREEEFLQAREQKIELERVDLEEKRLQRKADQAERFRQLQIPKEIAFEKLAALKAEEEIEASLREQQRQRREAAEIEAEHANRSAMEAKKKIEIQESIAAHRQHVMWEKIKKEREERQRALEERKAQIVEQRRFLEHQRLRAQENKEKHTQLIRDNQLMAAEKRARLEQQKIEDRDAALRKAEQQRRRDERLQQHVAGERFEATEALRRHRGKAILRPIHDPEHLQPHPPAAKPMCVAATPIHLQPRPPARVPAASPMYVAATPLHPQPRPPARVPEASPMYVPAFSSEGSSYLTALTLEPLPRLRRPKVHSNMISLVEPTGHKVASYSRFPHI